MKLSPEEINTACAVEDEPHEIAEDGVILWVSQQEYGVNQRALVSTYVTTPVTRRLYLICECSVMADGTIEYERSRFDGRDTAKTLFKRFMPTISGRPAPSAS